MGLPELITSSEVLVIKGQSKSARGGSKEVIVSLEASRASLVVPSILTPDLSVRWHRRLIIIENRASQRIVPQQHTERDKHPPVIATNKTPHSTARDSNAAGEICRADSCPSRKQKTASKDFRRRAPPALAVRLPSHKVSTCLAHQDRKKHWRIPHVANSFVPSSLPPRA